MVSRSAYANAATMPALAGRQRLGADGTFAGAVVDAQPSSR
jgi:hypothetical protein